MGTHDPTAPWFDVYTKEHCSQCEQTIRLLERLGARHRARPLANHPDARALAAGEHVTSAPLVVAMTPVGLVAGVWGGHRPDLIRRHIDDYAPAVSVWDEREAAS